MYETLKKISFFPIPANEFIQIHKHFRFAEHRKNKKNERGEDERNDIFHLVHVRDVCVYAPRNNHICSWKLSAPHSTPSFPLCGFMSPFADVKPNRRKNFIFLYSSSCDQH